MLEERDASPLVPIYLEHRTKMWLKTYHLQSLLNELRDDLEPPTWRSHKIPVTTKLPVFASRFFSTYCECYLTTCNWFQQESTAERREQRDDNVDFEPYNLTVEFWTYHFRTMESASSFHSAQCAIKSANLLFLLNKSISQTHPLQLLADLTCLIEIKWLCLENSTTFVHHL